LTGLCRIRSVPFPSAWIPASQAAWTRSSSKAATATDDVRSKYTKYSPAGQHAILTRQRLNRPVAPHLSIYKLEQTYLGSSAWMRITGCTVTGAIYVFFASYLVAPIVGLGFDSSALVSAFASLPSAVQGAIKLALAFPFTFHFFNGIKQLWFDASSKAFNPRNMTRSEISVWVISSAVSLVIAFGL
jgi:succinate dehydrogenase (ubiquinone) cytochrome b560 subunit